MELLAAAIFVGAFAVLSLVVVLGIIFLRVETQIKIKIKELKKLLKNEKHLDGAAMATVHDKEKKSLKLDVLKAGADTRFAEVTVTGKSTSFFLRNGRKIKV